MAEKTIESYLELLTGLQGNVSFVIQSSDQTILRSIARQVHKGVALTDRQYEVVKEKLLSYADQFTALEYDVVGAVNILRNPLRQIDRTKYIKIIDNTIKIRFPFSKKDIIKLELAKTNATGYEHSKGSHEHTFEYSEQSVFSILTEFVDTSFEIDAELIDVYNKIKQIKNSHENYIPGIYNLELKNVNATARKLIVDELGDLDQTNLIKYVDRRFKYGIETIDTLPDDTLLNKIAYRETAQLMLSPIEYDTQSVLSALWDLDRFPLLIILDKINAEEQLHELVTYYRDILPFESSSVLFRLDGSDVGFNTLVKDRKLNNWVDKSTKIVYISTDTLPKLLVNGDWKPHTAISYNSRLDRLVNAYVGFNCDLIVYREESMSPFRKYSKFYG